MNTQTKGQHLLAEYHGCDPMILNDSKAVERLMKQAVQQAGATIVQSVFHRFAPQGVSGVLVIQESHMSVHTWPEERYAAVDFYTCGDVNPRLAHPILTRGLDAGSGEILLVNRGEGPGPMVSQRQHWNRSDGTGNHLQRPPAMSRSGASLGPEETLLPAPTLYFVVSGHAEGPTHLNAFDHALLDAGIGDTNLIRMSSILPPGVHRASPRILPAGAMVPVAYARMMSDRSQETIAAAIAIALPEDPTLPGLIMEHHGASSLEQVASTVRTMAITGMEHRGRAIRDVIVEGAEHQVVDHGCAFAAAVLWHDPSQEMK